MTQNKKTCFLLGGGKSLSAHIEAGLWEAIKDKDVWSLNFAYKFMPFLPTRQCWVDGSFFRKNLSDLQNLSSQGVPLYCKKSELYHAFPFFNQCATVRETNKVTAESLFIGTMGLVGVFALSLAIKENYERIYLFGYDFGTKSQFDEKTHFYSDKVKEMNIQSSGVGHPGVYYSGNNIKQSVNEFDYFNQFNKEIYNVSTISNINSYPKLSYTEFLDFIEQTNLTKQT